MEGNPTSMRVADPGVRALFTLEARWQAWLDVEAALALAEAELGIVPEAAAKEIAAKARLELLDRARIDEAIRRTAHEIVPLVWELARVCEGDAGNYVHWGATTQNIVQTGDILQLRRAHAVFLGLIGQILAALADLAEGSAEMVLPGRTHGQHAVPATFGLKVATWIDELIRHQERLRQLAPRLFVAMLGGGAGTVASFGEHGLKVQAAMARILGLGSMPAPSRAQGDRQAELVCALGMLAATQSKIAREVFTQMSQEFGEVEEPVPPGTVGSSTMPQKRNPFLSQDVIAGAAEVRALVPLALEGMQFEGEADRKYSLMLRRATMQACGLSGDLLARTLMIVGGLTLKPERMRANLELGGGLIMAEPVMLSLGRHIGRQAAHDVVYEAAQASVTEGRSFAELLAADARVAAHLDAAALAALLDPAAYTGMSAELARSQAERARATAAELAAGYG